jgi:hypothetical protein
LGHRVKNRNVCAARWSITPPYIQVYKLVHRGAALVGYRDSGAQFPRDGSEAGIKGTEVCLSSIRKSLTCPDRDRRAGVGFALMRRQQVLQFVCGTAMTYATRRCPNSQLLATTLSGWPRVRYDFSHSLLSRIGIEVVC